MITTFSSRGTIPSPTIYFFLPRRQTSTWSKYSDQRFIMGIKKMKGLFIYLIAVNISEISEETT